MTHINFYFYDYNTKVLVIATFPTDRTLISKTSSTYNNILSLQLGRHYLSVT